MAYSIFKISAAIKKRHNIPTVSFMTIISGFIIVYMTTKCAAALVYHFPKTKMCGT